MLSKCFNPACSARFLYLHTGKVFRFVSRSDATLEPGSFKKVPQRIEYFWLCEECSGRFTLEAGAEGAVRLVAIHRRATGKAAGS